MRTFVEALCRLMLRIFFRRVDVVGLGHVPARGPLLIVANHPNGLMDPLVLLSKSPRPVSFMSKEPLFRTPVISLFVKGLDCLPVYRKKDGADTGANRRTMEAARALLARGGAIGIFPEGISHDEPQLQPLKTGAARMALAAQRLISDAGSDEPLRIQPVGLFFEQKGTFRSEAVIVWGPPIDVPVVAIDEAAEPGREDTLALTEAIGAHMRALTPEAPDAERVAMAARVARLLSALEVEEGQAATPAGPGRRLSIMQRLLSGHLRAEALAPDRLAQIVARIAAHERDLGYWRLPPDHGADLSTAGAPARSLVLTLLMLVALSPLALFGLALSYPAYRLIGWLARRYFSKDPDITATAKTLGGLLLFPLSWLVAAALVWARLGLLPALITLLLSPVCAFASLHFADHVDALQSARRSLRMGLSRSERLAALRSERLAIRDELVAIERELEPDQPLGPSGGGGSVSSSQTT